MSIPQRPGWQYQSPTYWETYLPQEDDYVDAGGYIDALAASAAEEGPNSGKYWDPIGQVWRGGRRTDAEIAASEYNSAKYLDPNSSFNAGMASPEMRLAGKIAHNPELARAGYDAHDEFGNPILDPAILAMIEQQLGIGPYEPPPPPRGGPAGVADPPPAPDVDYGEGVPPGYGGYGGSYYTRDYPLPAEVEPIARAPIDAPPPLTGMPSGPPGNPGAPFRPPGLEGMPSGVPGQGGTRPVSTIDPRYPDFILQPDGDRPDPRLQGGGKFGGRPNSLGAY